MAGTREIKLEEEANSEILVADADSGESGVEASDGEDYFEEEEEEKQQQQQQQQAPAEVATTNTGQRHQTICAAVFSRGQRKGTKCARCFVGLCIVPCFADYSTKVNL